MGERILLEFASRNANKTLFGGGGWLDGGKSKSELRAAGVMTARGGSNGDAHPDAKLPNPAEKLRQVEKSCVSSCEGRTAMSEDTRIDPAAVQVSVLSRGIVGTQLAIDAVMPLGDVALRVRESGKLETKTAAVRRVLAQEGRGGGYERRKLLLPAAVPAAQAPAGTPLKQLPVSHHNRLYGFDLDSDRDNLDVGAVRAALERHPAVVLVGISAAGDALYAWAAGPVATSATEYKDLWREIAKRLPGDAAVQNDARAHNFNRVRLLASDPTLYLATEATPFAARDLVKGKQGALL